MQKKRQGGKDRISVLEQGSPYCPELRVGESREKAERSANDIMIC